MDKLEIMLEHYGLQHILEQNDVEDYKVLQLLLDEGLVDLEDYFYEDELIEGEDD